MLRALLNNLKELQPRHFPPAQREGKLRVLALNMGQMGFKTFGEHFCQTLDRRDDVDATFISLKLNGLFRYFGSRINLFGGWDLPIHRFNLTWHLRMRRFFNDGKIAPHFDIIFVSPTLLASGVLSAINSIEAHAKPKLVVCSDSTEISNQCEFPKERIRFRNPLIEAEKRILSNADLIVMRSEWARSSVHRDYNIPDTGQSYAMLPAIKIQSKSRLDYLSERPGLVKIALVGNTFSRKGGPRLIRWHQERWKGKAELHIVSRDAPSNGQFKGVRTYPSLSNEQLVGEFLPSMDIFCLPTSQDQLAWVNAEAASAGLPIVASRMAGIPEVVMDGINGFTVPVHDDDQFVSRIEQLLSDHELRRLFGVRSREHAIKILNADRSYDDLINRMTALI